MIKPITNILLDIHETSSQIVARFKMGDTGRKIRATLVEGGSVYRIEPGCTAVFAATKPDGKPIYNDCEIQDNSIIYTVTEQTLAAVGSMNCEIKLYDRNGVLITSPTFTIQVWRPIFHGANLTESSAEYLAFAKIAGELQESTHLLTAEDDLNLLLDNGVYYMVGDHAAIRALLDAAGIVHPVEMNGTVTGLVPKAMFLKVTQGSAEATDPAHPVGQTHQHLRVYYATANVNAESPGVSYHFDFDRVCSYIDPVDGVINWAAWRSANRNVYELEKDVAAAREIFVAEYGVTTAEEIMAELDAGKICFCARKGYVPILPYSRRNDVGTGFVFAGMVGDSLAMYTLTAQSGWSFTIASYTKAVEVRNVDHDDTIPTVRAVYQKVAKSEEALTNVMPLIANRVSTPSGYSFDKTYAEIKEAVAAGRTVLLNNYNVLYAKSNSGPNYYEFLPFVTAETDVSKPGLKVTSADVWSEVATGVEPMTEDKVNELIDGRKELFVAVYGTTTTAELAEAVSSGKLCVCQLPNDDGGNKRGIALLRDNNGLNHFMFNAVLNSGTHAYALLDRSGWSYVEHPFVVDHKPLLLDADMAETYLTDSAYGDAALEAIKAGKQILVRVPNADGGNYTAIYSPILMHQVPNYANNHLYLLFLRDEKQDLSALLGQPAGTVVMPTYGELKMLLSQEYNTNPLES